MKIQSVAAAWFALALAEHVWAPACFAANPKADVGDPISAEGAPQQGSEPAELAHLELPAGAKVLRVFRGDEIDVIGLSMIPLADIDGDGVADVIIGGIKHGLNGGPGFIRAYSVKSGRMLYQVTGADYHDIHGGDEFGQRIARISDVDGDHVPDILASAPSWEDSRGYVWALSGKSGVLVRAYASEQSLGLGGLGTSLAAAIDADGDGIDEFAIDSLMYSARADNIVANLRGQLLSMTSDFDGDNKRDYLFAKFIPLLSETYALRSRTGAANASVVDVAHVCSSVTGRDLLAISTELKSGRLERVVSCGDVDCDGLTDVACVLSHVSIKDSQGQFANHAVQVFSGHDGKMLHEWGVDSGSSDTLPIQSDFGDIDGDGHADLLVARDRSASGTTVEIYSGKSGSLIATLGSSTNWLGRGATVIEDVDGDGRPELMLTEFQAGTKETWGGRAYLISLPAR